MSAEDLISGILVGLGGGAGLWELYHRVRLRRLKKRILRNLLEDPTYTWRTLKRLRTAIASDAETTKELLLEVGAKPEAVPGSKPEDEILWTL